jgi:DNA modification methylase
VKPVALLADAILDVSRRDEIVLDTFLGSGSTLIACERVGRRCRGIELDPRYLDAAIRPVDQPLRERAGFDPDPAIGLAD